MKWEIVNIKRLSLSAVVAVMAALIFIGTVPVWAATLQVDNGNPGCNDTTGTPYCTIQAAVDAAAPGDTIMVAAGTYNGGIVVDKAGLRLMAQGPLGTVKIVGAGGSGPVFGITVIADNVGIQGFEISGFNGQHDASGIFVGGLFAGDTANPADGADIEHNSIHDNGNGVYLWQSNNNRVSHNVVYNSLDFDGVEGTGILSFNGFGDAQTLAANAAGRSGMNNDISHNVVYDNDRLAIFAGACTEANFGCEGPNGVHADISGTEIHHNEAYGNGAHRTEAIGLLDAHGGEIDQNKAHDNDFLGIYINFSDGTTVDHNGADNNNGYGILVGDSNAIAVNHNETNGQLYGEFVYSTDGSLFDHNSAKNNSSFDLYWDGSGTNIFSKNKCGTASPSKAAWDCK